MAQTCAKCSRLNPPEALYCFYDGMVLVDRVSPGPATAQTATFLQPFIFPSGRTCRTFDELALACQSDWNEARRLLHEDAFASFFGALGRADLALSAREAARFPDHDRGLDQFLADLPTRVLDEPKLRCNLQDVNLGELDNTRARTLDLHLENQGMRLLYGTISAEDCPWLTLGDPPGAARKLFQFGHETTIPVHIRPEKLRASNKPFAGKLLIESNGGTWTVQVRAQLPIKPYPEGVLAGALSPRQIAEKAKASPREAAILFENGAVAAWYKSNGWTYPVSGPAASGLGAVQQFFEALGLTPPPKVQISERALTLKGNAGEALRSVIEVRSEEKRPVYAHAVSNQPWLEVSRAKLNGRVASIAVAVPAIPNRPGETLTAKLTVQANGNQRFLVPVTLQVEAGVGDPPLLSIPEPEPLPVPVAAPVPVAPMPASVSSPPSGARQRPARRRSRSDLWPHLLPAGALLLCLLAVFSFELWRGGPSALERGLDGELRVKPQFDDQMRFGLVMLRERDPHNPNDYKRLTYSASGEFNNTIIRIDEYEYQFGDRANTRVWIERKKDLSGERGAESTMEFVPEKVQVTQHVEIVRGPTGNLDTCLIYYTVKNHSEKKRQVGVRILLDTYIGANDGVPFTIPGEKGFVTTMREFDAKQVPPYIEAIEKPNDADDPGTVVRLTLKGVSVPHLPLEEVQRVLICRSPRLPRVKWQWNVQPMGTKKEAERDSCVAVYWDYLEMNPGDERHLGITYGLSDVGLGEGEAGTRLALSVPNNVEPNSEFDVIAYVWGAREGQPVQLELPEGLQFAPGEKASKAVEEKATRTKVSWRVKTGAEGTFHLKATSGPARAKPTRLLVQARSIFG